MNPCALTRMQKVAVVKSLDKTTTYGDIIERMELDTTVSDEIKASCEKM